MEPFSILIVGVVLISIGVLVHRSESDRVALVRKKILTVVPSQQIIEPSEAISNDALSRLNEVALQLPGFSALGEFVEHYPPISRFSGNSENTFRVLVDEERTTVAIVFRMTTPWRRGQLPGGKPTYSDRVPRLALITTLSDGRWVETQRHFELASFRLTTPIEMDLARLDWEIPVGELIEKHIARVKAVSVDEAGYRDKASPTLLPIRTMADYLVDHRRRWKLIREHQPQTGSRS